MSCHFALQALPGHRQGWQNRPAWAPTEWASRFRSLICIARCLPGVQIPGILRRAGGPGSLQVLATSLSHTHQAWGEDSLTDRVAYLNGEWVKESEATVSIHDRGFILADAGYEVARTFRHQPFRLERHMARLYSTLRYLAIDPGMEAGAMQNLALAVLERNLPFLEDDGEYRITLRVTRGLNPPSYPVVRAWSEPTILICTAPIAFASFAARYRTGVPVITPSVRRTPPQCLDPRAKTHERLNLIVGQLEVAQVDPSATPLLLDLEGNITESAAANAFFVCGGELWTPSARMVLGGITRETVIELAHGLGIPVQEREITLFDAYNAQEAFLTSTSYSIMPVSKINGRPAGDAIPGPVTLALTRAFGELVGVDIVDLATRHLKG